MKELFCNISPFIYKQKIYLIDTETKDKELLELCTFEDLSDVLTKLGKQNNIFNFHLYGDEKFIKDIGEQVEENFILEYSSQNIKVIYN